MDGRQAIRIVYINLDRSPDRRLWMEEQTKATGLYFERFVAVDGSAHHNLPKFPVSAGAIGCFLSHRELWRTIATSHASHAIVLEDDVHLSPEAASFFTDLSWVPPDADIVHVGGSLRHCLVQRKWLPVGDRRLFRAIGENGGTEAYIISKHCAAKLHRDFLTIDKEFDQILFNGGRPDLNIYKILPALCIQDHASSGPRFESLIERAVASQKLTGVGKLGRDLERVARKLAFWLRVLPTRRVRVHFR
jgi:glycosyl transferase family 25